MTVTQTDNNSRTYRNTISTDHAEPVIAGSGLDWPQKALKVHHEAHGPSRPHTMVDSRSPLLIDDGIGIQNDQ